MITDQQLGIYMKKRQAGNTQETAAAKAGMTAKTARKYKKAGKRPSEMKGKRNWRTRQDAFERVWPELEDMLVLSPELEAKTLMDWLLERYPDQFEESQLRTLQRRVRDWKAFYGNDCPVIFRQAIPAGQQSQSDYTVMNALGVTIDSESFPHLLYHFMLPYSRWETVSICFSESFDSLTHGFEQAVFQLGGVLPEHRTDNLSAATKVASSTRTFTEQWQQFLAHYQVTPSRNNPGQSHENGSVEKSHDLLKRAIDQQLMLRGSRDFSSRTEYEQFLEYVCTRRNRSRQARLAEELPHFKPLPKQRWDAPTVLPVRVSPESTIRVEGSVYSVPARLISHYVNALIYADRIEVHCNHKWVQTMPKLAKGEHSIQYRHIIHHLVRKPGAFAHYKYREDLFPHPIFRATYDQLVERAPQTGHKTYLAILHLAALQGEQEVMMALNLLQEECITITLDQVKALLEHPIPPVPDVTVHRPRLDAYDQLLSGGCHD